MQNNLRLAEYCEPLYCKIGRRWACIKGYENFYQISDDGLIRSLTRISKRGPTKVYILSSFLKPYKCINGSVCVSLKGRGEKRLGTTIGYLVAQHFIPSDNNKNCVMHIDGDLSNNHYQNLKWVTRKGMALRINYKKGQDRYCSKLTDSIVKAVRLRYKQGESIKKLSIEFSVSYHTMRDAIKHKTWKHIN